MMRPEQFPGTADDSYQIPSFVDQYKFLVRVYFGEITKDYLTNCIDKAYLDFSRTLRDIPQQSSVRLRSEAAGILHTEFKALKDSTTIKNQNSFDNWHRSVCTNICSIYHNSNFQFSIGQAQKWLNMSFKYFFVFREGQLEYKNYYPFGHVPIDNIILDKLRIIDKSMFTLLEPWSRIKLYADYLVFQENVRCMFPNSAPLAVEFHIWQNP